MSIKADKYFAEYRITNTKTGEVFEGRMLKNVLEAAGLSRNTPAAQLRRSKKWKLEQIGDPLEWDEASYRADLYKNTKHRYKTYEERKALRDPLFEKRKRIRLSKWKNVDGSPFTPEQHELMQQDPCNICGIIQKHMCVDHDHNTGFVRGTLCTSCNLGLGYVKDSTDILQKMISYLRKHQEKVLNEQNKS